MNSPRPEILIPGSELESRIESMAAEISATYGSEKPVVMPLLNGAFVFAADLVRRMGIDLQVEFLGVSSYGGSTESSGETRLTLDTATPLHGRHVLIVEDIVDTGLTLAYIQKLIRSRGVASLRTAVLLDKQCRRRVRVDLDWVGFVIPDRFVYGYGLDGPEGLCRNLPDIVALPAE